MSPRSQFDEGWHVGYNEGRAQAFSEMQQTIDWGMDPKRTAPERTPDLGKGEVAGASSSSASDDLLGRPQHYCETCKEIHDPDEAHTAPDTMVESLEDREAVAGFTVGPMICTRHSREDCYLCFPKTQVVVDDASDEARELQRIQHIANWYQPGLVERVWDEDAYEDLRYLVSLARAYVLSRPADKSSDAQERFNHALANELIDVLVQIGHGSHRYGEERSCRVCRLLQDWEGVMSSDKASGGVYGGSATNQPDTSSGQTLAAPRRERGTASDSASGG